MAIVNSYPIGTLKTNDLLVGTSMPTASTDADPITKNFLVSDIVALTQSEIGSVITSVNGGSNITAVTNASAVTVSAPDAVVNTTDTYTSQPKVTSIISLTQSEYDLIVAPNANTLYVII